MMTRESVHVNEYRTTTRKAIISSTGRLVGAIDTAADGVKVLTIINGAWDDGVYTTFTDVNDILDMFVKMVNDRKAGKL